MCVGATGLNPHLGSRPKLAETNLMSSSVEKQDRWQ
jgi:hypothetical protein